MWFRNVNSSRKEGMDSCADLLFNWFRPSHLKWNMWHVIWFYGPTALTDSQWRSIVLVNECAFCWMNWKLHGGCLEIRNYFVSKMCCILYHVLFSGRITIIYMIRRVGASDISEEYIHVCVHMYVYIYNQLHNIIVSQLTNWRLMT